MEKQVAKERYYSRRFIALIGLGLALLIMNIDILIINLALPVIGRTFHTQLSTLQWISNIYMLSMSSTVIFIGVLADRYGHRLIFLWGTTLFFLGSLVAGLAFSVSMIILGRFIQGIGMASTFIMIFVLATAAFPKHQRGTVLGLLTIFTGVGQAIGPTLGGMMINALSWRWAFLINAPICCISYFTVLFACQKDRGNRSINVHYFSALLLIIFCFSLLFIANESQTLSSMTFWGILLFSLLTLLSMLVMQKKIKKPLIDLMIFRNYAYVIITIVRILFQVTTGAFFFTVPLYLQHIEGFSPLFSGMVIGIMSLVLMVISPIAGKLNDYLRAELSLLNGQICAFISFILILFMPFQLNWILLILSLVFTGLNSGITLPSTNYIALHEVPTHKKGLGFGVFTANAFFFLSLGIALTGYLLNKVSLTHFHQLLSTWQGGEEVISEINKMDRSHIQPLINGAHPIETLKLLFPQYGETLVVFGKEAFLTGFRKIMSLLAGLTFLAILLSMILLKRSFKMTFKQ